MTRLFEKQEFESVYDQDSGALFEDYEFRRCRFVSCVLSITRDVARRSTMRRIRIVDGEEWGCSLECAVVEDAVIDGLKTSDLFQTWGAVFRHVTLRGKIDRIMLSPILAPRADGFAPEVQQRALDEANRRFYEEVDWALDIREAEFREADLRGVPGHLVRRDPETQVLVKREEAMRGSWRKVDLTGTYWDVTLDLFARKGRWTETVLVAPKRARNFEVLLKGLHRLREAGVAEPD